MKKTILLVALMALTGVATAQSTAKNVLFIGNSYTEVNNLPNLVQQVSASAGRTVTYQANTPGGCTFSQHCTNQSMTLICRGGWDAVVLQEQSQLPSFPLSQVTDEVFPYAARLVDSVYAHNPCADPLFYMTWGRKDGDAANAVGFPILATYEGMDSMLYERYMYMKNANDASVSPVGRVWRYLRHNYPALELYAGDGSHPSQAGSYAAACTFYVLLFEDSPLNITYDATLDSTTAQTIRAAVQQIVFDTLSFWQRPRPLAVFTSAGTDTATFTFHNASQNAAAYVWYFGDGDTSVEENPTHTFSDSGYFNVTLVASRHCMTDTMQSEVHVIGSGSPHVGINASQNIFASHLYPNPASKSVILETTFSGEAALYDMQGRLCRTFCVTEGKNSLDLSGLDAHIYVLKLGGNVLKVMVR